MFYFNAEQKPDLYYWLTNWLGSNPCGNWYTFA